MHIACCVCTSGWSVGNKKQCGLSYIRIYFECFLRERHSEAVKIVFFFSFAAYSKQATFRPIRLYHRDERALPGKPRAMHLELSITSPITNAESVTKLPPAPLRSHSFIHSFILTGLLQLVYVSKYKYRYNADW